MLNKIVLLVKGITGLVGKVHNIPCIYKTYIEKHICTNVNSVFAKCGDGQKKVEKFKYNADMKMEVLWICCACAYMLKAKEMVVILL